MIRNLVLYTLCGSLFKFVQKIANSIMLSDHSDIVFFASFYDTVHYVGPQWGQC